MTRPHPVHPDPPRPQAPPRRPLLRRVVLWALSFSVGGALAWSRAQADTAESCVTFGYILQLDSVTGSDEETWQPYKRMESDHIAGDVAYIRMAPPSGQQTQQSQQLILRVP